MVFLVDLFYLLAAPFFLIYILFRSRCFTRRRYRAGLMEKLGGAKARSSQRPCLWIHAVSVGEVRTSLPFIESLVRDFSDWDLVLSTSTDTGHDVAAKALHDSGWPVELIYYPLDLSWAVKRTMRAVRPTAVVLIELELWPNFLMIAKRRGLPVLVANGRLTERSARRYARIPCGRFLFSLPQAFAVQDEMYERRFLDLDVSGSRIEVLGNLKFDIAIPGPELEKRVAVTREALGWGSQGATDHSFVLMAGCTHPGEDEKILSVFRELLRRDPEARLILAPRHIERASDVADQVRRSGDDVSRWSELSESSERTGDVRVLVVDVIGELDRFYCLADLVFVGGTLVEHGGHNILEPARFGKPVLIGPSVHNFTQMVDHFLKCGAAIQVEDENALAIELDRLRNHPDVRNNLATRAREASLSLRGAVSRHVEWLQRQISAQSRQHALGAGRDEES